jgi:hypothetical protein
MMGLNIRRELMIAKYGEAYADAYFAEEAKQRAIDEAEQRRKSMQEAVEWIAQQQAPATGAQPATEQANSEGDTATWQEHARKIADELFDHDTTQKTRDCLLRKDKKGRYVGGYAFRVMEIMQERRIHGPRGLIDNAGYVSREALQGAKWWGNKQK